MKILRAIRWLLFLALLGAFATYVWPTRFRFDHMTVDGNLVPVRIDRFNGDADMLVPDQGWVPVEGQDADPGTAPATNLLRSAQRAPGARTAPATNPLRAARRAPGARIAPATNLLRAAQRAPDARIAPATSRL